METPATGASELVLRGRYRLCEVVGQGGMATIYRAHDEVLNRDVAVKLFRTSAVNQTDIDRQEAEIKLLASLSHHSLVTVIDAGAHLADPHHPQLFLVMELVQGEDLQQRLNRSRLSSRQIAQLGFDLAEGLEYIHDRGVVHRDIKPANILIVNYGKQDARPRAKLTDFGIAKLANNNQQLTLDGVTTGTAAYLSPEQAHGDEVGPASDVYSLGLVLLECHKGELEFPGSPVPSAVARLMRDPVIPAHLSPEWTHLLSVMTARNPDDRPIMRDLILMLRDIVVSHLGRHRDVDAAPLSKDEIGRMEAVRRYEVLDTPTDGTFDRITAMAARSFNAPIAIVSIVDHDRIWFKSHHGLELDQIGRDPGLCSSAILGDRPWVIEDARSDPRSLSNPLVASEFGLQFYAGVPLTTRDGYNLGTLCVLDFTPRKVTDDEIATLQDLAALVTNELDLRLDSRLAMQALSATALAP
ncbi:MAG: serine/threonine protein kinase [Homoserinimonas sp.]|nr:serine/threonine protein kinase [Homoserinimonas sp.]